MIGRRVGVPNSSPQWGCSCGIYAARKLVEIAARIEPTMPRKNYRPCGFPGPDWPVGS
ncbi:MULTISPECIES: hypothetical protein [unclassified Bradyrhizobium]|uniref:hypothetical protein n=1 Tax=unclassified Bradyrhizobium TaxID=2631580 RepID=UPI001FFA7EE5|nr:MULTISPECIES: hypothetical protein [unclassified Bradyrhizobium]MCK1707919.1 hypothetical protein [Bradyrhizobium sp. 143]MCK1725661.1 hypothetical protein [Bradyrhizobium sp. 142]